MASRPTTRQRNRKQKVKAVYAKAREDAQLAGLIETTPEGAVRDERVDPASQDDQRFPGLDRAAILADGSGWSVPEHVKRKVIQETAAVLFEVKKVRVTVGGVEVEQDAPPDRGMQLQASKVLLLADKAQHDRDHPEAKSKVNVNLTTNNIFADIERDIAVISAHATADSGVQADGAPEPVDAPEADRT